MICKVSIKDSNSVYSFRFTKSDNPKLEYVDGDMLWLDSDNLEYIATITTNTVAAYTAYIYVKDKYGNLIKTIIVTGDAFTSTASVSITATQLILSTPNIETGQGINTTSIIVSKLVNDLEFTNTKYKDFECSVDGVNYYTDKIPVTAFGRTGTATKTLYIRRTLNSLTNLAFTMTFSNSSSTDTIEIISQNESTSIQGWVTPTYGSGWAILGVPYNSLTYTKDLNGIVHISGAISGGATTTAIFRLPSNCKPTGDRIFATVGNNLFNRIRIDKVNGDVFSLDQTTNVHINISYKI